LPLLRAEKQLCRKGNKTVAVALSEYVKRQFRQHYDLAEERVKVIPNGIKLPLVPDNPELIKKEQFDKWGIRQCESPVFLFAAHNFRLKGLSPLIKAFSAALEQANRKACLVVIGRDNPKPYKKLAERLGGGKNIFFCPPAEKPAEMLTACDAVVLPTFYDPCSRFTLEALALFKPVITTRYNGVCDFITDGREGKIIDSPNDIDAITDAIIFFMNKENISHAEQNIKMGSLRSEISNQRVARQLNGLYEDIITKR
jgi:UDP-glucose:(heptosyl)LPS alpha-1,3-glucosyltransferase